jgi:hypothetical protein
MAANENQGLQIALIVFVMLTVLLIATTFLFFHKYDTQLEQSAKDQSDARKSQADLSRLQGELNDIKQLIGFAPEDAADKIRTDSETDWTKYADTLPKETRNYRAALGNLAQRVADVTKNLEVTQKAEQTLKDHNEVREEGNNKIVEEHVTVVTTTRDDISARTAKFQEDVQRLEKEKADLAKDRDKLQQELDTLNEQNNKMVSGLQQTVALREAQIKKLQAYVDDLRGTTEFVSDGVVRKVNQGQGVVWINIGYDDNVPRQLGFSVYGIEENGGVSKTMKAKVEITRILGPHLSEARILEDEINDPIVPGDKIHSPLWNPGRAERFALAGFMDVDGDDQSDRGMIRDLISRAGGTVDAELDDTGKEEGEITLDTRYLVIGESKDNVEVKVGQLKAQAEQLGVEVLSLEKFLEHVGWKDARHVLRYDGARPRDFKPRMPDGGVPTSTGNVTQRFRPRHPREKLRPNSSAFGADAPKPEEEEEVKPAARPARPAADADADADAGAADEAGMADEAAADEGAADEAGAEEGAAEGDVFDEPAGDEPAADEPAADEETPAEEPAEEPAGAGR